MLVPQPISDLFDALAAKAQKTLGLSDDVALYMG